MWVVKLLVSGENALIGSLCKKHDILAQGYPISIHMNQKEITLFFTLFLTGDEDQKTKFLKELKKSPRIMDIERNGDFIISQILESKMAESIYKYNLVHIEPVVFYKDGTEIWTVASWNKEEVIGFSNKMEEFFNSVKILKMSKEKISNISVLTMNPELTKYQREAISLAIQNGYYESPRKTELKPLAKIMKISYSTFQVHLRKAEKKLIPFFFERSGIR